MTDRAHVAAVKDQLAARIRSLVDQLAPGGRWHGSYWQGPNPTRVKDSRTSFTVYQNGGFIEFDEMDKPGTVLDLVMYCRQCTFAEAMRWSEEWLGIRTMAPADRKRLEQQAAQKREHQAREAEAEHLRKIRHAQDTWRQAPDLGRDGPVADYLDYRGVPVGSIEHPEGDERQHRNLALWGPRPDSHRFYRGPALVLPIRQIDDEIRAIQGIFVRPDGRGKLEVPVAKPVLGDMKGGAVRISRGPTGRTVKDWLARGAREDLCVGEGYETCRSIARGIPELRVWSTLNLGNLGDLPEQLVPHVDRLFVLLENDLKPKALASRDRSLEKLEAKGFDLHPLVPPSGNDFNDTLMEK